MGRFTDFWSKLTRDRAADEIAKQLYSELKPVTDGRAADQLVCDALDTRPPTFEECRSIVDVLSRLPQRQRAVIELRHKGMNPREIAAYLGIPVTVAIREMSKGLVALRKAGLSQ